jgi:hypothetical protein
MRSVPWPASRVSVLAKPEVALGRSSTPPRCTVMLRPVVVTLLFSTTTKLLVTTTLSLDAGTRAPILVEPVGSVVQMEASFQLPLVPPPLNVYSVWPIAKLLHKVANNPSRSVLIRKANREVIYKQVQNQILKTCSTYSTIRRLHF